MTFKNESRHLSTRATHGHGAARNIARAIDQQARPPCWRYRRASLMAGAAAGALCLASLPALGGPAACPVAGGVATCSGNQSGGIEAGVDFLPAEAGTLVIKDLTGNISPERGDGIQWAVPGNVPIKIISDTGGFAIRAPGVGFNLFGSQGQSISLEHSGAIEARVGIDARSYQQGIGDAGDITLKVASRIDAGGGAGISADSRVLSGNGNSGAISIDFAGTIISGGTGIFGYSSTTNGNAGPVTIASKGSVGDIFARSRVDGNGNAGTVLIDSKGDGDAYLFAMSTVVGVGDAAVASVTNIGNVRRIEAVSQALGGGNSGSALVNNTGSLGGGVNGIEAKSLASGTGNASTVAVITKGDIRGSQYGIDAASATNGTGAAAAVVIASQGNITAGLIGIRAQSIGAAARGTIGIDLDNGTVLGKEKGVQLVGGADNTLKVGKYASVLTLDGGVAIEGGEGNETVDNLGSVRGDVKLGAGVNGFNNFAGASFLSGSIVDLGAGGMFENAGLFSVGNIGDAPRTTGLTGGYSQSPNGVLVVDIAGATADRVNVSGAADVDGKLQARLRGLNATSRQYTIMSAAGGMTDKGIEGPSDTAVIDYELLFPNDYDMVLSVTADFVTAGLTPNQEATAEHLQEVLGAGGGDLGQLYGYLGGIVPVSAYAQALDRLHPEPYLAQTQSMLFSGLAFADGVLNCSDIDGANVVKRDDERCGWARIGGSRTSRDRTAENIGYDNDSWSASAGLQFALAPNWLGGIAVGYESMSLDVDDRARTSGDLFQLGAGALYRQNGWEFSGTLSAGLGSFDTTRFGLLPGVDAKGDNSAGYLSGRLRAAYVFGTEEAYLKPMVDLDVTALRRDDFTETGAGTAGLKVRSETDGVASVAPAVEIGAELELGPDVSLQPFLGAGVRVFSDSELSATASFIGSPSGVSPFTVTMPLDRTVGEVAAGVDLVQAGVLSLGVSYEGRFGDDTQIHLGAFSLRTMF